MISINGVQRMNYLLHFHKLIISNIFVGDFEKRRETCRTACIHIDLKLCAEPKSTARRGERKTICFFLFFFYYTFIPFHSVEKNKN